MFRLRSVLSLVVLILPPAFEAGSASAQNYVPQAPDKPASSFPDVKQELIEAQGHLQAAQAALTRQANGDARDQLKRARNVLEKALKANPASRSAAEGLGMVYFYEGAAGDKGGFERSSKFLQKVVTADPDALQAARFLAHAYARQNKARETTVYAGLVAGQTTDSALAREMTQLKRPFQQAFLTEWYDYGKYYESAGSRLMQINAQTYKPELVLQVTPQFEQELGAKGLQAIAPTLKMATDPQVKDYVQRLVDQLLSKTPGGPPFTYAVDIVESPAVNAMAIPGRILVNTGLLKFCESEAELVAVLSHEIAHIYAHHSARALVASYTKRNIASTLLSAVKVDNSNLKDQLLTMGVAAGLELLDRGYSRGEEKEADRYGTHIAYNAGYNPTFMTKFFLRLYQANPKQPFKLLSTHPPTTERIEYTAAYLDAFPLETEMQLDSQEFKDIRKRIK